MLFTSFDFIIFITLLFVMYYTVPKKYQWKLLLAFSYIFYFIAGPKFLFYILLTTGSTYVSGIKIGKLYEDQSLYLKANKELSREEKKAFKAKVKKRAWKWILGCLLLNFGILFFIKYINFTIANINWFIDRLNDRETLSFIDIALPLGISFYTFQTMGYIIDVYRGKYPPEKNFGKLALFVSFFPQLIQGPISRFDDLAKTLFRENSFNYNEFSFGLQRILWGYFKKLVIADRILVAVQTLIGDTAMYDGAYVFVLMVFYTVQLYCDFTGGIDITIGIAQILGIKVQENFIRPAFSKNIAEFWRRWHISLGTWFKEYLFYPLSIWKPMLNFSRFARSKFGDSIGKKLPVFLSAFVVWFITGAWHGASWNFIVWGLLNYIFLMGSEELKPFYSWFHSKFDVQGTLGFKLFQIARTNLLVSSIRLLDCYRDVPGTFKMVGSFFTKNNFNIFVDGSLLEIGLTSADYWVITGGLLLVLVVALIGRKGSVRELMAAKPVIVRRTAFYLLIMSILIFGAYGVGYESSQFIYNQF
ncbi:MBOAT family O-acyltransferase [Alkalibacter mobilis]|uniref:MBOAT family O-acyltransferase n=1 Tax=Alkalibacter mobilis TaxID=2787712 RepID=UPI00189F915B|nr:MBOAT family protein [Alkalibacter mobilis]MBF7097029.1 MBOAT family protein [Alkalibacter mobilis]